MSHDAGRLVHLLGWFGIALVTACLSMVIATLLHCWRDWPGSPGSVRRASVELWPPRSDLSDRHSYVARMRDRVGPGSMMKA
jgi:hypothetical protein